MGKSRTEDYRCSQSKECTYRQLQQERVQLLIGQSTLQIQEQSTLGTMQQSSLQHYSVLGSLLGNCTEEVRTGLGELDMVGTGAVRSYSRTSYRIVQLGADYQGGRSDFRKLHQLISRSMLITRKSTLGNYAVLTRNF